MIQFVTMKSETRKQRFRRLANKRVNNTLTQIRVLGNLANRSYYEYSDEDIKKIFKEIDEQLKIMKNKFKQPKTKFKI